MSQRSSRPKATLSSKVAVARAQHLPLKVCYWVMVRMGMRYALMGTGPNARLDPDVSFSEVLSFCAADLAKEEGHTP